LVLVSALIIAVVVLFLVLFLFLVLVLLLLLLRRRRPCRLLLAILLLLLPLALFSVRRHRLRRLLLPVLFLFAALFGVRRGRALRRGLLLLLAALLLLTALFGSRRGRALWRTVLLLPAKLFPLLQPLWILLSRFQDLFHLLRGCQRLCDHSLVVGRGRALRLLQKLHLLAHLRQRTLEQCRDLVPPHARQFAQRKLRLYHHSFRGAHGDRLAECRQLADLIGPFCSKIDIEFRFRAPLAGQGHPRIFHSQLVQVERVAGQAVCRDKRRAPTDSCNSYHHRQNGGKHLIS